MAKKTAINMRAAKTWLRGFLTRRRLSLSSRQRARKSGRMAAILFKNPAYQKARVAAFYLSFGSEVSTDAMIRHAWAQGKRVLIPMTTKGFSHPFFVEYQKGDSLKKNRHGFYEPSVLKKPFAWKKIDVVIVPGLGFDRQGYRLGYGGGVYDRLIKKTPQSTHIGVFFKEQFLPFLPIDRYDLPVDKIIFF